jgi:hypothetical protein
MNGICAMQFPNSLTYDSYNFQSVNTNKLISDPYNFETSHNYQNHESPKQLTLFVQHYDQNSKFPQISGTTDTFHKHPTHDSVENKDLPNTQTEILQFDIPSNSYDNSMDEQKFCGGYGEWGHVINRSGRSILQDLIQYPLQDDIKNGADMVYNKMKYQVRRGKIRFQMLFFCTYCAHLELPEKDERRGINPVQLGIIFGLTQSEVQRCDSLFSPLQTGYRPPSSKTSPLGYLPDYCQNMELSQEAIDEIMIMSSVVLMKDPTLFEENPQTVAAGLLRYYTVTNGIITDDPQKITRVTKRSTVTIDGMFRRISTIDNN